ncbi:MAG: S-methyl-5-thioribose-1-phosphate isomerase [Candidatus Omnitrophota bacterium]
MKYFTLRWTGEALRILDQSRLPGETVYLNLRSAEEIREAIRSLRVRGAPALGVAAAYGLYLGMRNDTSKDLPQFLARLKKVRAYLETSRPTAVNLFHALRRMEENCQKFKGCSVSKVKAFVLKEAQQLHKEDETLCKKIADFGNDLIPKQATILTHCNAGALATAGMGTALAIIFRAKEKGKKLSVFADETRPLLQGSRLTVWELQQRGIKSTLICDNMAGWVMKKKRIDLVLVGADRIAANGDTANKIGTYSVAILARHHKIPFYVAAPMTTFDLSLPDGKGIPIEERPEEEVTCIAGKRISPGGIKAYNPAFDVTPAELITAFVTDQGILRPPFRSE